MKWQKRLSIIIGIQIIVLIGLIIMRYQLMEQIQLSMSLSNANPMSFIKERNTFKITAIEPLLIDNKEVLLSKRYKVGEKGNDIFSLSYVKDQGKEGTSLKKYKRASSKLTLLLKNSYPNITKEEMGFKTEEEAYLTTQLAVFLLANETRESWHHSKERELKSLVRQDIFNRAKEQVRRVQKFRDQQASSKVSASINNKKIRGFKRGEHVLFGPYGYKVENATLERLTADVTHEDGSVVDCTIVDDGGKMISDLGENEKFYIKVPSKKGSMKVQLHADVKETTATIYRDDTTDYLVPTYKFHTITTEKTVVVR